MIKLTKKLIKNSFLELLKVKSLDKVTVTEIVESCEINRNTFYYYYSDIYDLLEDIFKEETEKVISEEKSCATFYEEYLRCATLILGYKKAVINIYHSKGRNVLENYIETVTKYLVRRFVLQAAQGYTLTEENLEYICDFYSYSIIGTTVHWIDDGMNPYREDLIRRGAQSFEVTIHHMINFYSTHK